MPGEHAWRQLLSRGCPRGGAPGREALSQGQLGFGEAPWASVVLRKAALCRRGGSAAAEHPKSDLGEQAGPLDSLGVWLMAVIPLGRAP